MDSLTIPKLPNGLTPLLSKSLDSQALAKHRALVAFELEVMAVSLDRFGWQRDRGKPAQDRMVTDWMDVLQDYPVDEIAAACRQAVLDNPNKMPNYGHVRKQIIKERGRQLALQPKPVEPERPRERIMTAQRAAEIMEELDVKPNRFGEWG